MVHTHTHLSGQVEEEEEECSNDFLHTEFYLSDQQSFLAFTQVFYAGCTRKAACGASILDRISLTSPIHKQADVRPEVQKHLKFGRPNVCIHCVCCVCCVCLV